MQTRSNNGLVEDLASGQALEGKNRNAESSSCKTIPKALQKPAGNDVLPEGKGVWLLSNQKAFENPGSIGTRDPIKVNTLPDNKKSGKKDEIVAEIEQLKKK